MKNKEAKKAAEKTPRPPQRKRGRPAGSPNQAKTKLDLSPELVEINEFLAILLKLLGFFVKVSYLALDGHFGHNQAVLMARAQGLQLISKLRKDAALYEKHEGEYRGRGAKKKYGKRLRDDLLPPKYLQKSETEGHIMTNYYQGVFLHREFGCELNVVVIVKLNLRTRTRGHALLFSSEVTLSWEKVVDYYSLRFQIEFNFRAAKQHFGLEDFMNITQVGVENGANLAFLMVNVSATLMAGREGRGMGVNDLKSRFRGLKYAVETIKMVLAKAEGIIMAEALEQVKEKVSQIGSIHQTKVASAAA